MLVTSDKRSITIGMMPSIPTEPESIFADGTAAIGVNPVLFISKPGGLEMDVVVVLSDEDVMKLNAMLVSVAESCGAAAVLIDTEYQKFGDRLRRRAERRAQRNEENNHQGDVDSADR
jgi:hypothetical protein